MAVTIDSTRKAVNLTWDNGLVGPNAVITATNPDTGDVSTHAAGDDGYGAVTFPKDYKGTFDVSVTGEIGTDTGEGLKV